ncbi:hypothetical protein [Marinobacter sp. HN1S83]|uniref:hypothetical protein n=1 Tax=Marinobacter sp. HN1S83 TaxID=3382301 RepID=UPI00387AC830
MTEGQESKILQEVVKRVEGTKPAAIMRSWFNWALWIACVLILLLSFQWYESASHPAILLVGGGLVGILVGGISVMQTAEKNWSVIKKYIDTPAIKEKLDDSAT